MNITWKKAVKAVGGAATVITAASLTAYCTSKYLMKIAMDREPPKAPKGVDKLIAGMIPSRDFWIPWKKRRFGSRSRKTKP